MAEQKVENSGEPGMLGGGLRFRMRNCSSVGNNAENELKRRNSMETTKASSGGHHSSPNDDSTTKTAGIFEFFIREVTTDYALENDEARFTEKRKKVYAFIKIPRELERFLFYGFLQCSDAFLYIFTFLPIRVVLCFWHLLQRTFSWFSSSSRHADDAGAKSGRQRSQTPILSPPETCDLLKVCILLTSTVFMTCFDTSWMYHVVRGQAVIKLYILYNMLEVVDKLFSSLGQDILDALFWTATEPHSANGRTDGYQLNRSGRRRRLDHFGTLPHLCLAIVYVFVHAMLVLFQATTLNVAFNSHNKALLTIMLSNNFVELKGSVFKKFAKNNLFQMACSDVRERFHNGVLLSVVIIRNMTAVNWRLEHLWEMLPDLALVIIGEFMVDWIKHAFITKFNEIAHDVYKDFTITIAYDVARSRQKSAFSDYSDQVSRRMGFIPLPLGALTIRILSQSLSRVAGQVTPSMVIIILLSYLMLLSLKVLNSVILLGKACRYIQTYEEMQKQGELLRRIRTQKAKSVPASPRLSLIEFGDVMQQNCPAVSGYTVSDVLRQAAEELAHLACDSPSNATGHISQHSPAVAEPTPSKNMRRSRSVVQLPDLKSRQNSGNNRTRSPIAEQAGSIVTGDTSLHESSSSAKPNSNISECESLKAVDRYTLCNDDRIES